MLASSKKFNSSGFGQKGNLADEDRFHPKGINLLNSTLSVLRKEQGSPSQSR